MRLVERIEAAGLSPEALAAFREGLLDVAGAGRFASMEHTILLGFLDRLVPHDAEPGELRALWPHAELFLTAALTVAVSDGVYGVEEARVIGTFAARLGYPPADLAELEGRVFDELAARGRALKDQG
jgi:hypothetical protein